MGDPGSYAQQHRCVVLLTQRKRSPGKVERFLTVGGLEQGQFRGSCIVAIVLLILRAVAAWVVGRHNHQPCADPGV